MLTKKQVVRSKSELVKEIQALPDKVHLHSSSETAGGVQAPLSAAGFGQ